MEIKTLAIITARGGSKRIPKKNIKSFCGKPIIAYSIQAAKESQLFDEIMVSTDSEEIAEIAKQYGAVVPFMRSEKTSSDTATTNDVLFEVFNEYSKRGHEIERACCIYPTAPFITSERLVEGYHNLDQEGIYMSNTIVKYSYSPQRAVIVDENRIIRVLQMENRFTRSQDLKDIYHDCGQFYWYKVPDFMRENGIMDGYSTPVIVDELHAQDIDNETDWEVAEIKYEILKRKGLL